jgi:EAL domain-containing protein (putative c-di-GMP-specific phosphodiesterase class I)
MHRPGKILVIDDEIDIGEFIAASARVLGLRCVTATDASALPILLTPDVTLILLDLMMPEMDGVEALRLLSELECKAGVVLISGINKRVIETAEKLARTLGLNVVGNLVKPFNLTELDELLLKHHMHRTKAAIHANSRVPIPDAELIAAIERDEFVVHYQPQIEIETGAVIGIEALVRWRHPKRDLIFPDQFISRLEELNLIDELGWLVAKHALSEVSRFAVNGNSAPRLALNVSVDSLRDLKFPDRVAALLNEHDMPTDGVILEITESGLINELARTLDVLTRLRVKGIQLSIDDFGTGYAMMEQLVNIPATELKIDRSFVSNSIVNSSDRVLVQKTIEIGHELGMKVVAEGVETDHQLSLLRNEGCDIAQGYLYSRPLPSDQLREWLTSYLSSV